MRFLAAVFAALAAGCGVFGDRDGEEETRYSFRPADHRPKVEVAPPAGATDPAAGPTRTSVDLPVASPAPSPAPAAEGETFVRLRGSDEIHVSTCDRVLRTSPDDVVPAPRGDGPATCDCIREDALARDR